MAYEETVAKINKAGWFILNTCQLGLGNSGQAKWRVNCQLIGTFSTNLRYTEYADAADLETAVEAAYQNVLSANRQNKQNVEARPPPRPQREVMPDKLVRKLDRALDNLWMAVRISNGRTRSRDREDSL